MVWVFASGGVSVQVSYCTLQPGCCMRYQAASGPEQYENDTWVVGNPHRTVMVGVRPGSVTRKGEQHLLGPGARGRSRVGSSAPKHQNVHGNDDDANKHAEHLLMHRSVAATQPSAWTPAGGPWPWSDYVAGEA